MTPCMNKPTFSHSFVISETYRENPKVFRTSVSLPNKNLLCRIGCNCRHASWFAMLGNPCVTPVPVCGTSRDSLVSIREFRNKVFRQLGIPIRGSSPYTGWQSCKPDAQVLAASL